VGKLGKKAEQFHQFGFEGGKGEFALIMGQKTNPQPGHSTKIK
jgi:hypothetical protein